MNTQERLQVMKESAILEVYHWDQVEQYNVGLTEYQNQRREAAWHLADLLESELSVRE